MARCYGLSDLIFYFLEKENLKLGMDQLGELSLNLTTKLEAKMKEYREQLEKLNPKSNAEKLMRDKALKLCKDLENNKLSKQDLEVFFHVADVNRLICEDVKSEVLKDISLILHGIAKEVKELIMNKDKEIAVFTEIYHDNNKVTTIKHSKPWKSLNRKSVAKVIELKPDKVIFKIINRRYTVCEIVKDEVSYVGVAICSIKDRFEEAVGKNKAMGRALKAIEKGENSDPIRKNFVEFPKSWTKAQMFVLMNSDWAYKSFSVGNK